MPRAAGIVDGKPTSGKNRSDKICLAIVGSGSRFCGIASYIRYLTRNLKKDFDVMNISLDQTVMRDPSRQGRNLADAMLANASKALRAANWLNIHLEPSTLGVAEQDIANRFRRLIEATPNVIVTFHSLARPKHRLRFAFVQRLIRGRIGQTLAKKGGGRFVLDPLWHDLFEALKRREKTGHLALITHTPADAHMLRAFRFRNVFDHPLC